jgi:hypothetical protein
MQQLIFPMHCPLSRGHFAEWLDDSLIITSDSLDENIRSSATGIFEAYVFKPPEAVDIPFLRPSGKLNMDLVTLPERTSQASTLPDYRFSPF